MLERTSRFVESRLACTRIAPESSGQTNCARTQSRRFRLRFWRASSPRSAPRRVRAEYSSRRDLRSSSPCRPGVTRSSSPPAPSSTISSIGCGRCCVPRCPMATSPRSSTTPSARRSRGSRPAASRRRTLLARSSRTRAPPRLRATSRRPCGEPCTSATGIVAVSSTREVGAAPSGTGSSSTTGTPSAWAATTIRETSACSVGRTTSCWRAPITGCSRRPHGPGRGLGRRPLRCRHLPRTGHSSGRRRCRRSCAGRAFPLERFPSDLEAVAI